MIADLQPEEAAAFTGRLAGMIAYEAAEAVALNVAGGAIKAGKLPKMIAALEKLPGVDPAKFGKLVQAVEDKAFPLIVHLTRKNKHIKNMKEFAAFARSNTGVRVFVSKLSDIRYPVARTAHHIFPIEKFNSKLGKKLFDWGIDLIGDENGVWLPTKDYAGRVASIHRGKHNDRYARIVIDEISMAKNKEDALDILATLKNRILNGTLKLNTAQ